VNEIEVITGVPIKITVSCNVTLCSPVDQYHCFVEPFASIYGPEDGDSMYL
jgi:hypothetical protein